MTPCQHTDPTFGEASLIKLARDKGDDKLCLPLDHFRAKCHFCGALFIVKPLELKVKYPEEKKQ